MFSVIMPVFITNEETLLLTQQAIASLGEVYLIIVDNGSTLGGGYLRSVADLYIRNKDNLGYAKATNLGLKVAPGRYIAVVNNDVRVSPNWQEVVKEIDKSPVYSIHFRMTDYDVPFQYGTEIVYWGKERWCTGSFYVICKKPILYDEKFLNSYDDWDYFLRVRKFGFRTVYTDKACYQHQHSFTQQQIPEREENNHNNAFYFIEKWGAPAEELFAKEFPEQMKVPYSDGFKLNERKI